VIGNIPIVSTVEPFANQQVNNLYPDQVPLPQDLPAVSDSRSYFSHYFLFVENNLFIILSINYLTYFFIISIKGSYILLVKLLS
jgi:hypothetical protein